MNLPYTLLYVGNQHLKEAVDPSGLAGRMHAGRPTEPVYILENFEGLDTVRGYTALEDVVGGRYIFGDYTHV